MKSIKGLVILGVLMVAAVPAFAQSAGSPKTALIALSATVVPMCEIAAGAVAFDNYDTYAAGATAGTGTFDVRCTKNATGVTVGLGDGLNLNRTMAGATDSLAYSLLDGATVWTDTAPKSVTFANRNWQTLTITGSLAAGQDVSDGAYTDTVVATINF